MLYQMNSSGGPLTGNSIKYNTFSGNDVAVVLWDGKYNTTQGKGAMTFYRDTYVGNTKSVTSESYTSARCSTTRPSTTRARSRRSRTARST